MDDTLMARPPGKLMAEAFVIGAAFVFATLLAVIAVAGGLPFAVAMGFVGGVVFAWVREHV